jgi:hypothetical protein
VKPLGLVRSFVKAALIPTGRELRNPCIGNLIIVAANVPPITIRIPGRFRKIPKPEPVRIAKSTTVRPINRPASVVKSINYLFKNLYLSYTYRVKYAL